MLSLKISTSKGHEYLVSDQCVHVELSIMSDDMIEIGSRVDVNGAFLTNKDNEDSYYGYTKNILGVPSTTVTVSQDSPFRMTIDLLEEDEDFDDFVCGTYECDVKLKVYVKEGGHLKSIILKDKIDIEIN